MKRRLLKTFSLVAVVSTLVTACGQSPYMKKETQNNSQAASVTPKVTNIAPQADRQAILAMAGAYSVTFDFTETVSFKKDYTLKPKKLSYAKEVVFVVEDKPDFISLQHVLVILIDKEKQTYYPIKHWRQDWQWQPKNMMNFVGANAWKINDLSAQQSKGKWSQTVYQVDDGPRYSGLGAWSHEKGSHIWEGAKAWRPLPRRDATTRTDYHVIEATNRHAITPTGWVHEQDNAKLVIENGVPSLIAVEVGVNTYVKSPEMHTSAASEYWAKTKDFWAAIRNKWSDLSQTDSKFLSLTMPNEPEALYMQILGVASSVNDGEQTTEQAVEQALQIIDDYTYTQPSSLTDRLKNTGE